MGRRHASLHDCFVSKSRLPIRRVVRQSLMLHSVTGAIGEVTGGVNVYSLVGDGVSGFIKGNLEFGKDDYLGVGGSFGVRVDW